MVNGNWDSQLWYAFARLDAALNQLEVQKLMAMPPHQREAKFECARLPERLTGEEEVSALHAMSLSPSPRRRVYRLSPGSREVKLREGDISLALAPEDQPDFLNQNLRYATEGTILEQACSQAFRNTLGEATEVSVAGIDRDRLLIAVDGRRSNLPSIDDIERASIASFDSRVVLDKVHHDYFTRKLLDSLRQIGNPQSARENPLVRRAVGQLTGRGSRQTAHNPPADFLWGAGDMQAAGVRRNLGPAREELERKDITLNATQWRAWEHALSRRLTLIWGSSENLMNRVQALARWQSGLSNCQSVQHTLSQQVEPSSPVHRTLDELELVYPALDLSLAVGQHHRGHHSLYVLK